jgi:hypothetical protein
LRSNEAGIKKEEVSSSSIESARPAQMSSMQLPFSYNSFVPPPTSFPWIQSYIPPWLLLNGNPMSSQGENFTQGSTMV